MKKRLMIVIAVLCLSPLMILGVLFFGLSYEEKHPADTSQYTQSELDRDLKYFNEIVPLQYSYDVVYNESGTDWMRIYSIKLDQAQDVKKLKSLDQDFKEQYYHYYDDVIIKDQNNYDDKAFKKAYKQLVNTKGTKYYYHEDDEDGHNDMFVYNKSLNKGYYFFCKI